MVPKIAAWFDDVRVAPARADHRFELGEIRRYDGRAPVAKEIRALGVDDYGLVVCPRERDQFAGFCAEESLGVVLEHENVVVQQSRLDRRKLFF